MCKHHTHDSVSFSFLVFMGGAFPGAVCRFPWGFCTNDFGVTFLTTFAVYIFLARSVSLFSHHRSSLIELSS
jgi:hypothetical protein